MISLGDTTISLHILQLPLVPGGKGGILGKVGFGLRGKMEFGNWGEGDFLGMVGFGLREKIGVWKFFFGGGGGGCVLPSQNSKYQDLAKFQLGERGGGVLPSQNSKCQDLAKFQFSGGRGGKGSGLNFRISEQGVLPNLSTKSALPLSGSLWITDSFSHTTYVETNDTAQPRDLHKQAFHLCMTLTCTDKWGKCPRRLKGLNYFNSC